MAKEEKQEKATREKKEQNAVAKPHGKPQPQFESSTLIRILGKDIRGDKKVLHGLTFVKGISWAFSNAMCLKLKIDQNKKIKDLSQEEIAKISEFVKNPQLPQFLMNRRRDIYHGKDGHLIGADLDLQREFDIKRLKKIKSFKGQRHTLGQPVRGQRTKSHFRTNKTVGVQKKKTAPSKK